MMKWPEVMEENFAGNYFLWIYRVFFTPEFQVPHLFSRAKTVTIYLIQQPCGKPQNFLPKKPPKVSLASLPPKNSIHVSIAIFAFFQKSVSFSNNLFRHFSDSKTGNAVQKKMRFWNLSPEFKNSNSEKHTSKKTPKQIFVANFQNAEKKNEPRFSVRKAGSL